MPPAPTTTRRHLRPDLLQRLPLPIARLYLRAYNSTGYKHQHDNAYYLLEATLKLLAVRQLALYRRAEANAEAVEQLLPSLPRAALGHYVGLLRETARATDDGTFDHLTRKRDLEGLRRARVLFAEAADTKEKAGGKSTILGFFDGLVTYRNVALGHGAARESAFYKSAWEALIGAAEELFIEADPLQGWSLVVSDKGSVSPAGETEYRWRSLVGPTAMPLAELEVEEAGHVLPGRVYLHHARRLLPVHGMIAYLDDELHDTCLFLNKQEGQKLQLLCYSTGRVFNFKTMPETLAPVGDDFRALLEHHASGSSAAVDDDDAATGSDRRMVGGFEIVQQLGRGGMGEVYEARQVSMGRDVALKILPPALANDPIAVGRFRREIQMLSRCDHPNIVKVFTSGRADGTYHYAMELIQGTDLSRVLKTLREMSRGREGALSVADLDSAIVTSSEAGSASIQAIEPEVPGAMPTQPTLHRVCELIRDAALGVQHLHDMGIVHRDLKPANLMLTRDGSRIVVMDLGLAKAKDASASLTLDKDKLLGTLRYMPPEQLQRSYLEVDHRADVYALGATLYELCCLAPLFDAPSEQALVTALIQYQDPISPRRRNTNLDPDLEAIIRKATAPHREDRYPTASAFAADLDNFIAGAPISARPPTLRQLASIYYRRHRTQVLSAATALGAVVLITVAFIAFLLSSLRETEKARREANRAAATSLRALGDVYAEKQDVSRAALHYAAAIDRQDSPIGRARLGTLLADMPLCEWEAGVSIGSSFGMIGLSGDRAIASDERSGAMVLELPSGRGELIETGYDGINAFVELPDGSIAAGGNNGFIYRIRKEGDGYTSRRMEIRHPAKKNIRSIALSPDGRRLVFGDYEGGVFLASLEDTGKRPTPLIGAQRAVRDLAFSRDGARLAGVGDDVDLLVWSGEDLSKATRWRGHTSPVRSLRWTEDRVLTAGLDGTIRTWSLEGNEVEPALTEPDGIGIWSFDANDEYVAAGSSRGRLTVWRKGESEPRFSARVFREHVVGVAFVEPSGKLVVQSRSGRIEVRAPPSFDVTQTLSGLAGRVNEVAVVPDRMVIAADGRFLRRYRLPGWKPLPPILGHTGAVQAMAVTADAARFASASYDGTLRVFSTDAAGRLLHTGRSPVALRSVAAHRGGFVTGDTEGAVTLWTNDLETTWRTQVHGAQISAVAVISEEPDLEQHELSKPIILTVGDDGSIAMLRLDSGALLDREMLVDSEKLSINDAALDPEAPQVVVGLANGQICLVGFADSGFRRPACRSGGIGQIEEVEWTSSGLVAADDAGMLALLGGGQEPPSAKVRLHGGNVWRLTWDPAGGLLYSSSWDRRLRAWRLPTHRRGLPAVRGLSGSLWDAELVDDRLFLAGGKGLERVMIARAGRGVPETVLRSTGASVSEFYVVRASKQGDVLAGGQDALLYYAKRPEDGAGWSFVGVEGHTGYLSALAVPEEGRRAVSGDSDGRLIVWSLEGEAPEKIHSERLHEAAVEGIVLLPGNEEAISAARDGSVVRWRLESGEVLDRTKIPSGIRSLAIEPGGELLFAGATDGRVSARLARDLGRPPVWDVRVLGNWVNGVAPSPDGGMVLAAGGQKWVVLETGRGEVLSERSTAGSETYLRARLLEGRWMVLAEGGVAEEIPLPRRVAEPPEQLMEKVSRSVGMTFEGEEAVPRPLPIELEDAGGGS